MQAPDPRYGDLMLRAMLRHEGLVSNRKRTWRLYTTLAVPARPNERWSADFVHDQLADGRWLRTFALATAERGLGCTIGAGTRVTPANGTAFAMNALTGCEESVVVGIGSGTSIFPAQPIP